MVFASFGGKIIWQQLVCNSSLTKGRRSVVMPSVWKCFCFVFSPFGTFFVSVLGKCAMCKNFFNTSASAAMLDYL